jgi:hypothetical protein
MGGKCGKCGQCCQCCKALSFCVPCVLFESSEEESDEDQLAPSKNILGILKGLKLAAGSWGSSCLVMLCCASALSPPTSALSPPTSALSPPTSALSPPTSCLGASCVHCLAAASRHSFPRGPLYQLSAPTSFEYCMLSAPTSCMHSSPSDDAPHTDKRRGLVGVEGGVKMARLGCVRGASRCLVEWLMSLLE